VTPGLALPCPGNPDDFDLPMAPAARFGEARVRKLAPSKKQHVIPSDAAVL